MVMRNSSFLEKELFFVLDRDFYSGSPSKTEPESEPRAFNILPFSRSGAHCFSRNRGFSNPGTSTLAPLSLAFSS